MSSRSELGHVKIIANLNILNTNILALGARYTPANPKLELAKLQTKFTEGSQLLERVNNFIAPYSLAVDARESIFAPYKTKITKVKKIYFSTEGVEQAQKEDFMTISRKLKGGKKSKASEESTDEKQTHSTSQMSYDQRTDHMDLLISLLQNTPNYNPNEDEFKTATLIQDKADMLQSTQKVTETYTPLSMARADRNEYFYYSEDNIVDDANRAKEYLLAILEPNSPQYKVIAKLKFVKPRKY